MYMNGKLLEIIKLPIANGINHQQHIVILQWSNQEKRKEQFDYLIQMKKYHLDGRSCIH